MKQSALPPTTVPSGGCAFAPLSDPSGGTSPRKPTIQQGSIVAELWSNASEFSCPKEFLAVLTDELDDLCKAYGRPLPGDFGQMFGGAR